MTDVKVTKVAKFEVLKGLVDGVEFEDGTTAIDFLNHEIELITKRSKTSPRVNAKKQAENAEIFGKIKDTLADGRHTASEIGAVVGISTQKVSAVVRHSNDGSVITESEKRVTYYKLAE